MVEERGGGGEGQGEGGRGEEERREAKEWLPERR